MELLALIFFLWLIGHLFPSSGNSYGPSLGEIAAFVVCAAVIVMYFVAILYLSARVMHWSGTLWAFPAAFFSLLIVTGITNRLVCDALVPRDGGGKL